MPRSKMYKYDILAKVYKLKNSLYENTYSNKGKEWNEGAHFALNKILDVLNEYSD